MNIESLTASFEDNRSWQQHGSKKLRKINQLLRAMARTTLLLTSNASTYLCYVLSSLKIGVGKKETA